MGQPKSSIDLGSKPAWEGAGTFVGEGRAAKDGEFARELAGIDWKVEEKHLFFADSKTAKARRAASIKAIVRETDQKLLSVMGVNYRALQHSEGFALADYEVKHSPKASYVAAGTLSSDRVIWMLTRGSPTIIVGKGDDAVDVHWLSFMSHDGSLANAISVLPVRHATQETLTVSPEDAKVILAIKQVPAKELKGEFQRVMAQAMPQVERFEEMAKALAKARLSVKQMEKVAALCFPGKSGEPGTPTVKGKGYRDTLVSIFEEDSINPGTAWSAWCAVCKFADQHRTTRVAGITASEGSQAESRLHSAWFGKSRRLKVAIVEALLKGV